MATNGNDSGRLLRNVVRDTEDLDFEAKPLMDTSAEIVQVIDRLRSQFEDLAIRGLRAAGAADLAKLRLLREELERVGAGHMASQIAAIVDAIDRGERSSAQALLRAQASLRVFERILTLSITGAAIRSQLAVEDTKS